MHKNDLLNIYDVALFNISDFDILLHETLKHARELLSAQAGAIYIKENDGLKFHIYQNDVMSYENIYRYHHFFKDYIFPLEESNKNLIVNTYLLRKISSINDIYETNDYTFDIAKDFDNRFNYKTQSVIYVPLIHPENNVCLGVIEIVNKIVDGDILPFDDKDKELMNMISSFMSLSILKAKLNFEAIIEKNKKSEEVVEKEITLTHHDSAITLHHSKKKSMAEMLSNIAHQWRQPLSMISSLASGLSLEIEFDKLQKDDAMTQLRKIVLTTQNLSQTIEEFRNFYKLELVSEDFTLESIVVKCLDLSEVIISHNKIKVITTIDKNLTLYGYKNEFVQAILNVLSTLKDSLLKDENLKDKQKYIFINISMQNNNKVIKICDNSNHKIDYDDKEKQLNIFNLGLYITKLIIEKHFDGDVEFNNIEYSYKDEKFVGGEYTITLP